MSAGQQVATFSEARACVYCDIIYQGHILDMSLKTIKFPRISEPNIMEHSFWEKHLDF